MIRDADTLIPTTPFLLCFEGIGRIPVRWTAHEKEERHIENGKHMAGWLIGFGLVLVGLGLAGATSLSLLEMFIKVC